MTQRLALFAFLLTASPMLMAHASHDHGHWSASLIHLLWALPVIVAGAIAFWGLRRIRHQKHHQQGE
ncbi:hypothetical protein [Enterovibrio norvegicus]|uniref:hypothetical protein n=1 Tax=Enterovibrio norvegicus TaxID=188144 RepID=UPI00352F418D